MAGLAIGFMLVLIAFAYMQTAQRERGSCQWKTQTPTLIKKKAESAGERAWAADVLAEHGRDAGGVPFSQNLEGRRKLSLAESAVFWGIPSGRTMETLYLGITQSLGGSSRCRKPERLVLCGRAVAAVCCCCLLHLRTPASCSAGSRLPTV